jgi:hypothetical protein
VSVSLILVPSSIHSDEDDDDEPLLESGVEDVVLGVEDETSGEVEETLPQPARSMAIATTLSDFFKTLFIYNLLFV